MAGIRTKTVVASNAGNVLEWYDFFIFAYLAPYLSDEFFPSSDPFAGLIQTYGVFALGYFARPIGGVIFGYLGDRFGRRLALRVSIVSMMVPTTLIAVVPTHQDIGTLAALLLIALRIIQGMSVGGEQGGSICYLVEVSPPGRKGLIGSLAYTGSVFGILLGSFVVLVAKSSFTSEEMHDWAWRIPFLGAILLGLIGLWVRRHLHETDDFLMAQERGQLTKQPLAHLFTEAPFGVLKMIGVILYTTVSFYTVFAWLPTYASHFGSGLQLDPQLINTVALLVLLCCLPIGGHLADRLGYKRVLIVPAFIGAILIVPIFLAAEAGSESLLMGLIMLFAVNMAMANGALPIAITDLMPAHLRFTGVAVTMNIEVAVFGGTVPLIATWLIATTGNQSAPAWYLIAISLVSILATLTITPGMYTATALPSARHR
ncbi:MAG: MFS transporter [Pseudomonadota bacterium]